MTQPTVFINYSHKDEEEKQALLTHLNVLNRAGLIDLWSDDQIKAGDTRQREIEQAMKRAKVAILLISANLLASEFIVGQQIPILLQRRKREGLTIFPVIAKACAWKTFNWLKQMEVRPKNGRPVWSDNGSHAEDDLAAIADEVAIIIREKGGLNSHFSDELKGETNMASDKESRAINISSGGSFQGIIAVRDLNIENSAITIGDQTTVVNKQNPSFEELKQLLTEVCEELAEITAQKEVLKAVSAETPHLAQNAEDHVKSAAEKIKPEMLPNKAKSVQDSLTEATNLLTDILGGAKSVAQKAEEVGRAVMPIVGKLELLVQKLEAAVIRIAILWPLG